MATLRFLLEEGQLQFAWQGCLGFVILLLASPTLDLGNFLHKLLRKLVMLCLVHSDLMPEMPRNASLRRGWPPNIQKIPKKYENGPKITIFFRIFGGQPGVGDFVFMFSDFSVVPGFWGFFGSVPPLQDRKFWVP